MVMVAMVVAVVVVVVITVGGAIWLESNPGSINWCIMRDVLELVLRRLGML